MPDNFDPYRFAKLLIAAHNSLQPLTNEDIGSGPTNIDDVDIIHTEVMRAIGPAGAFKTAYPEGRALQIMAPIPARFIRPSPARYEAAEMRLYGIELEIAFRIDSPVPDDDEPDFEQRLRDAVSLVPVIEMVDSRIADRDGASPLTKLADNQSNFGLVVGTPVKNWQHLDLTSPAVTFTVNGVQTGSTAGMVPGGHSAFEVLKGMVPNAYEYCGGLKVGQYVTCGALTGLHFTEAGAEVAGSIAGIGDVAVTIGS